MPTLDWNLAERILARVEVRASGCWIWLGCPTSEYGRISIDGVMHGTHRVLYQVFRGPLSADTVLDHLCRNQKCVNPDHLEATTVAVNTYRGVGPSARNKAKTHCELGHLLGGINLAEYVRPDGRRYRGEAWKGRFESDERIIADLKASFREELAERDRLAERVKELETELIKAREAAHYVPSREAEELIARCAALEAERDSRVTVEAHRIVCEERDRLAADFRITQAALADEQDKTMRLAERVRRLEERLQRVPHLWTERGELKQDDVHGEAFRDLDEANCRRFGGRCAALAAEDTNS